MAVHAAHLCNHLALAADGKRLAAHITHDGEVGIGRGEVVAAQQTRQSCCWSMLELSGTVTPLLQLIEAGLSAWALSHRAGM